MPGSWHPPDPGSPPTGLCRLRLRRSLIADFAPAPSTSRPPCAGPVCAAPTRALSIKRCRACASASSGGDGLGTPSVDLAPPPRRNRLGGRTSSSSPLQALAALAAAAIAPATAFASPTPAPSPPSTASRTSHRLPPASVTRPTHVAIGERAEPSAPPVPSARSPGASRPRPRAVPPRYTLSDGQWVEDFGWTLLGRGTAQPSATLAAAHGADDEAGAASAQADEGEGEDAAGYRTTLASAMADSAPTATASLADSTSPSATSDSSLAAAEMAAQPSDSATLAAASSSPSPTHDAISIPDGWQAKSRETDYYAVPIIIAMSVLVAVIVVVSIFVSVLMRRKKRRRARRRHGKAFAKELEGEKGWRGMVDSAMHPVRTARANKGKKRARESVAAAGGEARGPGGGGAGPAPQGGSGSGGSAGAYRRVRATAVAASASRARTRRRRRRDGDDDGDEDEATALTRTDSRSTTSSVAHDTLTARLSARMRGDRPSTGSNGGSGAAAGTGAATVFSRDVTSRSQVSLTASALSRVSSHASHRSSRSVAPPSSPSTPAPPELLFTPADDPTLPDHLPIPGSSAPSVSSPLARERSASAPAPILPPAVSSFGALITTDALPAPGPPAYRPSSSTVQSTRRYGAGEVAAPPPSPSLPAAGVVAERPRARRVLGRRRDARAGAATVGGDDDDAAEGEWHWPGEKGRALAGEVPHAAVAGPSSPPPPPSLGDSVHAESDADAADDDEAHPPVDRALFSAHIATDDKAVLARLRAQRDARGDLGGIDNGDHAVLAGSSSGIGGTVPAPSAPHVLADEDDPELDEDGFERYYAGPSAPSPSSAAAPSAPSTRAWPAASTSFLPAPPQPVHQSSFAYSSAPSPAPSSPLLTPRPTTSASVPSKAALAAEYGAADADEDVDALPRYLAGGSAGREALGLASAPVGSDDEDDEGSEDDLEYAEAGVSGRGVRRNEGEREEEGVV